MFGASSELASVMEFGFYRQTDRQTTDGRATAYRPSERERVFTFAKSNLTEGRIAAAAHTGSSRIQFFKAYRRP